MKNMPVFPSFKYVYPFLKNKKVLDLGCNEGKYLKKFPKSSLGIDFLASCIKLCRKKKLNVKKSDLNKNFNFTNEKFDAVFAAHIIEHVFSPIDFLKKSYNILKKKGFLVLGVPVYFSVARVFGDKYFKNHKDHLYAFSLENLKVLLEKTNFKTKKIYIDVGLIRFPKLSMPLLALAQKLPLFLTSFFANMYWIIAEKNE